MMKLFIFAITILFISMESDSNSQIFINSRTVVFIDKHGEFFDSESMSQKFMISFDDSVFVQKITQTNEETVSKIFFVEQAKDELIGEVVTRFKVKNSNTQQNEFYVLWQRESGEFSLFQELLNTKNRVFFDPSVRCIH
jgi:hypothetical protein